jgi:Ubiquitin carboxyl-terminal hydrolase, family 1.
MLRDFGVKGVKIQEVVSLDEEMMAFLKYVVVLLTTPHCALIYGLDS